MKDLYQTPHWYYLEQQLMDKSLLMKETLYLFFSKVYSLQKQHLGEWYLLISTSTGQGKQPTYSITQMHLQLLLVTKVVETVETGINLNPLIQFALN